MRGAFAVAHMHKNTLVPGCSLMHADVRKIYSMMMFNSHCTRILLAD
jgi:hypothetical protein